MTTPATRTHNSILRAAEAGVFFALGIAVGVFGYGVTATDVPEELSEYLEDDDPDGDEEARLDDSAAKLWPK